MLLDALTYYIDCIVRAGRRVAVTTRWGTPSALVLGKKMVIASTRGGDYWPAGRCMRTTSGARPARHLGFIGRTVHVRRESVWRSTAAGLRYTFAPGPLRRLVLVTTGLAATMQFAQGSLVFYLVRGVGLPEAALGLVTAGMAVGGVLGASISPRLVARTGRRHAMVGAAVLAGLAFVGLGLAPGLLGGVGSVAGIAASAVLVSLRRARPRRGTCSRRPPGSASSRVTCSVGCRVPVGCSWWV